MTVRRTTIAFTSDDAAIVEILRAASAEQTDTSVLRSALRLAYAQFLSQGNGLVLCAVTCERLPKNSCVMDGVASVSKLELEKKFKRHT